MNWHKITQYSNVYQICVGVCMSFMLSYADNLEENQASDNAIFSVRGGGGKYNFKSQSRFSLSAQKSYRFWQEK